MMDNRESSIRCEWCSKEVELATTHCPFCRGPVKLLHPSYVLCGWCGTSNRRDLTPRCESCTGILPSVPGGELGPVPPLVPRELPRGYRLRTLFTHNVVVIIGLVFLMVALIGAGVPFLMLSLLMDFMDLPGGFFYIVIGIMGGTALMGVWAVWIGISNAQRRLKALVKGVPVTGEIVEIFEDMNTTRNEKHPLSIRFRFKSKWGTKESLVQAWDPSQGERQVGEPVWVVQCDDDQRCCSIWPPIK